MLLEQTELGTYELVPAAIVPKDQLWFHHPEMERRVAEAEADVRDGPATSTSAKEEAKARLDRLKDKGQEGRGSKTGGPDRSVAAALGQELPATDARTATGRRQGGRRPVEAGAHAGDARETRGALDFFATRESTRE